MAEQKRFHVNSRVHIALNTLPHRKKKLIEAVIESPQAIARAIGRPGAARRLRTGSQLYYMPQVAPDLQLIYVAESYAIFVMDLRERTPRDRRSPGNARGARRTELKWGSRYW